MINKIKNDRVKFKPERNTHLVDWIKSSLRQSEITQFLHMATLGAPPPLPAAFLAPRSVLREFPTPAIFPDLPLGLRPAPGLPQREEPIYQDPDEAIAQIQAFSVATQPRPRVQAWGETTAPPLAYQVEAEALQSPSQSSFNPEAWSRRTLGVRPHLDDSFADSFEDDTMQ